LWLQDTTVYCNCCGSNFINDGMDCCETPQIGTNLLLLSALVQENKVIRETRDNDFASNKNKTFRLGISITPRLLHDLEQYSINTLKEPLWKDAAEMNDFMKAFPEFTIPRRV
jgi:hypothetical protein